MEEGVPHDLLLVPLPEIKTEIVEEDGEQVVVDEEVVDFYQIVEDNGEAGKVMKDEQFIGSDGVVTDGDQYTSNSDEIEIINEQEMNDDELVKNEEEYYCDEETLNGEEEEEFENYQGICGEEEMIGEIFGEEEVIEDDQDIYGEKEIVEDSQHIYTEEEILEDDQDIKGEGEIIEDDQDIYGEEETIENELDVFSEEVIENKEGIDDQITNGELVTDDGQITNEDFLATEGQVPHIIWNFTQDLQVEEAEDDPNYFIANFNGYAQNGRDVELKKSPVQKVLKLVMYSCPDCSLTFKQRKKCEEHIKFNHCHNLVLPQKTTKVRPVMEKTINNSLNEIVQDEKVSHIEQEIRLKPNKGLSNVEVFIKAFKGATNTPITYITDQNNQLCLILPKNPVKVCKRGRKPRNRCTPPRTHLRPLLPKPSTDPPLTNPISFTCLNKRRKVKTSLYKNNSDTTLETSNDLQVKKKRIFRKTPLVCSICNKHFHHKYQFNLHLNYHMGIRPYVCELCGKAFHSSSSLTAHRRTVHEKQRTKICETCGRAFFNIVQLKNHMATHSDAKPFQCSDCGLTFKRNDYLILHYKKMHSDNGLFVCPHCAKMYSTKQDLTKHELFNHHQNRYKCATCNEEFRCRLHLLQHKQVEHGNGLLLDESQEEGEGATNTSLERFPCSICFKTFSNRSNLNVHERIHSGLKPYSCDICQKSFGEKYYLRKHRVIHGERSHACSFCDKTFLRKIDVNRHERIHKGIKPYSCVLCEKRFHNSTSLKTHELSSHKDQTITL